MNQRYAEVSVYDSVGAEDCLDILMRAAMHRIMTGEDYYEPIPREVKDFIIKTNTHI